jgi:hypothetical protein
MKTIMKYDVTQIKADDEYKWELFYRYRIGYKEEIKIEAVARFKSLHMAQSVADLLNAGLKVNEDK